MGETAANGGAGTELEVQETERIEVIEPKQGGNDGAEPPPQAAAALRWERFLPKMVLRVLLVEADDSTRQIIAALLRKCSYRVAAVPDGLKAWEVLKERPSNVDLILTEVELPSISGYALLTLIMEHEICKNIPVIMMSSNDSVSMVYKCMLRGAADFLVKPVRKNELRNLWQHVWRRQAANRIDNLNGPVSPTRNEDCNEKGSDDENSCVKLEMEIGGENTEHDEESEQRFRGSSLPIHPQKQEQEDHNQIGDGDDNVNVNDDEDDPGYLKSSKQAIDLIGAFDNSPKCDYRSSCSKDSADKVESLPPLDLSLTRYPSGSLNRLNHSDASAFTRYINKGVQPRNSMSPKACNQHEDCGTDSDKNLSVHTLDYISPTMNFHTVMQQARAEPGNNEIGFPIPVRGVGFKGLGNAHSSMMSSAMQSPGSAGCPDSQFQTPLFHLLNHQAGSYQHSCGLVDQNTDNDTSQSERKEENHSEPTDDHGHFSSFTDQSANSRTSVPLIKSTAECEKAPLGQDRSYQQSQREAALTKFRLKRKDRCFEKKVRYESRKKLAEQRPRVKGQFVRQQPK